MRSAIIWRGIRRQKHNAQWPWRQEEVAVVQQRQSMSHLPPLADKNSRDRDRLRVKFTTLISSSLLISLLITKTCPSSDIFPAIIPTLPCIRLSGPIAIYLSNPGESPTPTWDLYNVRVEHSLKNKCAETPKMVFAGRGHPSSTTVGDTYFIDFYSGSKLPEFTPALLEFVCKLN